MQLEIGVELRSCVPSTNSRLLFSHMRTIHGFERADVFPHVCFGARADK